MNSIDVFFFSCHDFQGEAGSAACRVGGAIGRVGSAVGGQAMSLAGGVVGGVSGSVGGGEQLHWWRGPPSLDHERGTTENVRRA